MAFQIVAALKPTVHVDCVAKEILNSAHKGIPEETMVSDRQSKNLVYQFTKRAIDIGFVFFVIMLLWWVLLFAWMTVKFTSSGPGIFLKRAWENMELSSLVTNLELCTLALNRLVLTMLQHIKSP